MHYGAHSLHPTLTPLSQVIEFALPEDIERLRHSKKKDLGLSEKLELSDDAAAGVNFIELSWRWVPVGCSLVVS